MEVKERSFDLKAPDSGKFTIDYLRSTSESLLGPGEVAVRYVITGSSDKHYSCEVGIASNCPPKLWAKRSDLFNYRARGLENTDGFNAVLLVPTGIGADIGGHAGDATAVARLLAENCDRLVLHPNVVNASDINELPENALYVEGSVVTRLLMGTIGLASVRANRVLVVLDDHLDQHFVDAAINSVSAARATYGLNCPSVVCLRAPFRMFAEYSNSGRAAGRVEGLEHCIDVLEGLAGDYDAVALSSVIRVPHEFHMAYFDADGEMVNPWGGVEAMLTHTISSFIDVPTAHSPMFESRKIENLEAGVVEPRMAAEAVSLSFLQCILKGLQKSPRIVSEEALLSRPDVLSIEDVSCLVIPDGCLGLPTLAALQQGIHVIAVRENRNLMRNDLRDLPWRNGQFVQVNNYLEAAGVMNAIKAGVSLESVRRPISATNVVRSEDLVSKMVEAESA